MSENDRWSLRNGGRPGGNKAAGLCSGGGRKKFWGRKLIGGSNQHLGCNRFWGCALGWSGWIRVHPLCAAQNGLCSTWRLCSKPNSAFPFLIWALISELNSLTNKHFQQCLVVAVAVSNNKYLRQRKDHYYIVLTTTEGSARSNSSSINQIIPFLSR